jgi:uncharacterized membrane protein YedE/YeeE
MGIDSASDDCMRHVLEFPTVLWIHLQDAKAVRWGLAFSLGYALEGRCEGSRGVLLYSSASTVLAYYCYYQ